MFEQAVERAPAVAEYRFRLGRAYGDQAMNANKFRQAILAKKVQSEFESAVSPRR